METSLSWSVAFFFCPDAVRATSAASFLVSATSAACYPSILVTLTYQCPVPAATIAPNFISAISPAASFVPAAPTVPSRDSPVLAAYLSRSSDFSSSFFVSTAPLISLAANLVAPAAPATLPVAPAVLAAHLIVPPASVLPCHLVSAHFIPFKLKLCIAICSQLPRRAGLLRPHQLHSAAAAARCHFCPRGPHCIPSYCFQQRSRRSSRHSLAAAGSFLTDGPSPALVQRLVC
jgi:hypothetical protein